jgi:hypothetical protein
MQRTGSEEFQVADDRLSFLLGGDDNKERQRCALRRLVSEVCKVCAAGSRNSERKRTGARPIQELSPGAVALHGSAERLREGRAHDSLLTAGRIVVAVLRRSVLLIVLICVAAGFALAQRVDLRIAYENKGIYVPGSDVLIKFTIRNDSGETYWFKLAENRMFSVDLEVRTLANQGLPPARQFTTERTSNQQLYYRDVALEPGEEFSFVENLGNYVQLRQTGIFVVRGVFYPDLVQGERALGSSNTLSLTIQPDLSEDEVVRARIDQATGAILERTALPPNEVVEYTIDALQDGAWNRFFLYLDLEGLLLSDPERARSYRRLSEPQQRNRLELFQGQLRNQLADPQLSAVPTDYEMVRTTYDPLEGSVIMDLNFAYPTFSELKRYTYFLRRRDSVWYIYDYAVTNLGTE